MYGVRMDNGERRRHTRCSFCGKGQDQVRKLVAGPGVYICDSCIQLCNEVLEEDRRKGPPPHESQQEAVRTAATRHHPSFLERLRSRLSRTVPAAT